MLRIAVFVSGRGSNLRSILDSIPEYLDKVTIQAVISNKPDCGALEIADAHNIRSYLVSAIKKDDFLNYDELLEILISEKIDFIVLAGFLKKIPDEIVDKFKHRIINIHPALLPSFGGKGMYGMKVHQAVFDSSAKVSGPTVHFVDSVYDNGNIIAQEAVDISDVDSPGQIAEKVLKVEHKILPFVIKKISEQKVVVKNNRVYILN